MSLITYWCFDNTDSNQGQSDNIVSTTKVVQLKFYDPIIIKKVKWSLENYYGLENGESGNLSRENSGR